jgi:hypothetical protein
MAVSKARKVELQAESRAEGRDIGEIPKPANMRRRRKYANDLLGFMRAYLGARFPLPFSPDHLLVIERLQVVILGGGLFAVAMPRGSGKTTLCEAALIWALVYGHRKFVMSIAADGAKAIAILRSIKDELAYNDDLAEDFPEACFPVRALGGIARRAEGQRAGGVETKLVWTKEEVRLPHFAPGGGSCLRCAGMTGAIRGAKAAMSDGSQIRPDLVLVDDPQTDASAKSPSQVNTRLSTINSTILGLAGPGQTIACLITCTIIARGDLADQLLDRKANPAWQGQKAKLIQSMPLNMKLWDEYTEILREDQRMERGMERATEFYKARRADMDAGAAPSWPQRFSEDEISAVQNAMNLLANRGREAFQAEYQNDPSDPTASGDLEQLTPATVLRKLSNLDRGLVTIEATMLTASIDVQGAALYWGVSAWSPGFAGDLIDYGCYPDQQRPYFTIQEIERTLVKEHPGASWEASLYAGLDALVEHIAGREWIRDDGSVQRIEQIVIDAGYGASTDTVYQFCRRSKHSAILLPFFGRTVAAGAAQMDEWQKKPGDRVGPSWRVPKPKQRQTRHILADVNKWKSFVADRLLTAPGDAGSLSIFGRERSQHRMLADQLCAEYRTRVTANGRTCDQWHPRPNRDNHLLDVLMMTAVGASIRGMRLDEKAVVGRIHAADDRGLPARDAVVTPNPRPTAPRTAPPRNQPSPPKPTRRLGNRGGLLSGFGFGVT